MQITRPQASKAAQTFQKAARATPNGRRNAQALMVLGARTNSGGNAQFCVLKAKLCVTRHCTTAPGILTTWPKVTRLAPIRMLVALATRSMRTSVLIPGEVGARPRCMATVRSLARKLNKCAS